ncbi:patatin-like phospholipase family protein [Nocardia sp. NPDC004568]|uniref:patatin-like phospholipase family protein n=1 Tax=Nocardia sp. NPDC004568 TaxID=3154551 RepID=UPI0033A9BEB6
MTAHSPPVERPIVRILAGVAGRSLALMVGMAIGSVDALTTRRAQYIPHPAPALQPMVVGVSGGALAATAVALGMSRDRARQLAIDHPEHEILGARSFHGLLTRRVLYPQARIRELAHAFAGDRTFADFALGPPGSEPHRTASSLLIPVYAAGQGTLLLPRDLPKLGLADLPVADAIVAATRIPGALPAAVGLDNVFDGGCQYRVPREIFAQDRALILDLYGPEPHDSRGGLIFPLLHPALPAIAHRPRPFRDLSLCESTIFAHQRYGAALSAPACTSAELFDTGYDIATTWIRTRTDEQLLHIVDDHVLGSPSEGHGGDRQPADDLSRAVAE